MTKNNLGAFITYEDSTRSRFEITRQELEIQSTDSYNNYIGLNLLLTVLLYPNPRLMLLEYCFSKSRMTYLRLLHDGANLIQYLRDLDVFIGGYYLVEDGKQGALRSGQRRLVRPFCTEMEIFLICKTLPQKRTGIGLP